MKKLLFVFALLTSMSALALTDGQIDDILSRVHTGKTSEGFTRKCEVNITVVNSNDIEIILEYGVFGEKRYYLEGALDELGTVEIDKGSFSKIVSFEDSYTGNELLLGVGYYRLNGDEHYKITHVEEAEGRYSVIACEYM